MNFEIVKKLDEIARRGSESLSIANMFEKSFAVASVASELKKLLTPEIMKPIMELQGTKLGFKTDKIYPESVVKECLIEATIHGVYTVGNMFNIIAGNFYVTKEGFNHKLKQIEGLSFSITPGIPKGQTGGATVDVEVEWTYKGKHNKKILPLAIKVNAGMGSDAINGKATRKASAWLFNNLTGQCVGEGDVSDADVINVTPEPVKTSRFEKAVESFKEVEAKPFLNYKTVDKEDLLV